MRYLKNGKRTPDYSKLFDIKYAIRRTDGSESVCHCPKSPTEAFSSFDTCKGCPFKVSLDKMGKPQQIGCAYRFEHMAWDFDGDISSFERRLDGFVESVTMSDPNGEARIIKADCPNTFLRTLAELWAKYKPLRYIITYNTKTQRTYSVFNPG